VRSEPQRIVSLLPSHTETLFALGLGSRVVGVDDYSDDPVEATRLPKLGGLYDVHVEQLLSLKPDLVLLSEWSSGVTPLDQTGATTWAGSAQTFDDVFRVIETVGKWSDEPRRPRSSPRASGATSRRWKSGSRAASASASTTSSCDALHRRPWVVRRCAPRESRRRQRHSRRARRFPKISPEVS